MSVNKVFFGAVSIMDISDSTVTADKLAKGVTAYDKTGEKITGTMEASSAPILQEKTVTPSTAAQNITADNGYDGLSKVTVNGDANLTADNIKSGTSIFGVTGSYVGSLPNLQSKSVTYTSNGTNTITPDEGYDALSSVNVTVNVSGGGGGGETPASANWNDVTFIDYDRSVLYSYTLEEAQALTDLPTLPSHDGLVCQGWNWTLEAIKALNRPVTVGAMYITDDGATRLHIRIATVGRMTVPLYIGQTMSNGVSIDWGDGSTTQTLSGTGNVNTSHTYAEPGDYVISLMPEDGCTLSLGSNSDGYCVIGQTGDNNKVYCNMLQDVSIGKNVTSTGAYAFNSCYSLANVTIPDSVTSIGQMAFQSCYSLASITIPDSVTSIENYAFAFCYGVRYYDFSACTDIPTLTSTNTFNSIPSDCQMLIPSALFNAWSAATNWATYASYMVTV